MNRDDWIKLLIPFVGSLGGVLAGTWVSVYTINVQRSDTAADFRREAYRELLVSSRAVGDQWRDIFVCGSTGGAERDVDASISRALASSLEVQLVAGSDDGSEVAVELSSTLKSIAARIDQNAHHYLGGCEGEKLIDANIDADLQNELDLKIERLIATGRADIDNATR